MNFDDLPEIVQRAVISDMDITTRISFGRCSRKLYMMTRSTPITIPEVNINLLERTIQIECAGEEIVLFCFLGRFYCINLKYSTRFEVNVPTWNSFINIYFNSLMNRFTRMDIKKAKFTINEKCLETYMHLKNMRLSIDTVNVELISMENNIRFFTDFIFIWPNRVKMVVELTNYHGNLFRTQRCFPHIKAFVKTVFSSITADIDDDTFFKVPNCVDVYVEEGQLTIASFITWMRNVMVMPNCDLRYVARSTFQISFNTVQLHDLFRVEREKCCVERGDQFKIKLSSTEHGKLYIYDKIVLFFYFNGRNTLADEHIEIFSTSLSGAMLYYDYYKKVIFNACHIFDYLSDSCYLRDTVPKFFLVFFRFFNILLFPMTINILFLYGY